MFKRKAFEYMGSCMREHMFPLSLAPSLSDFPQSSNSNNIIGYNTPNLIPTSSETLMIGFMLNYLIFFMIFMITVCPFVFICLLEMVLLYS